MNCPFCNRSVPEGALFCGYCGNKLTGEAQSPINVTPDAPEAFFENTESSAASGSDVSSDITEASGSSVFAKAAETLGAAVSAASGSAVSAETPDSAVSASPEANVTHGTSVNVLPEMPENMRNGSAADLGKKAPKSENKNAARAKNMFQNIASSVRNDTQNAAQAVKSRSFKDLLRNKMVIICCAAIIAVILLIVIIACCAAISGSELKVKGSYYPVKDGGDTVFLYNGAVVKGTDFSSSASVIASSLDGTAALVRDSGELYILRNGKAALITDEFDTEYASISANGRTAAYASDDSVYVCTDGKPKKIADVEDDAFCFPVVSPDGKAVAFADIDDDDINTYAWKGGKAIDLDSDIIPFSVSNGGKLIYGIDRSGELCYIRNLKKDADESIDSITAVAGISLDHTKLLYIREGSTYCFDPAIDDEDGVRVARDVISPISEFTYQASAPYIKNFSRFCGSENNDLYEYFRKGKDYDDEKLISDAGGLVLSEDGKSFVYIDEGDVMRGTLSNARNAKKVGKDAVSVRANDTLSSVFYIDDDYDLRYAGKDGKIASDVDIYLVTDGGVCVFSDDDGELWYSVKGGSKKKAGLDEIEALVIRDDVIYAVSDGELYTSTNGKSFKNTGLSVD